MRHIWYTRQPRTSLRFAEMLTADKICDRADFNSGLNVSRCSKCWDGIFVKIKTIAASYKRTLDMLKTAFIFSSFYFYTDVHLSDNKREEIPGKCELYSKPSFNCSMQNSKRADRKNARINKEPFIEMQRCTIWVKTPARTKQIFSSFCVGGSSSSLVFNRQHVAASIPLWLTPAFQGAGDLLVLWATTGTDVSLTVDGWSGSIWSVQPWTGMMNTASSVNSCHQSRGVAMAGDSHTPAPGPRCGERRAGWLRNAGQSGKSEPMLHIAM